MLILNHIRAGHNRIDVVILVVAASGHLSDTVTKEIKQTSQLYQIKIRHNIGASKMLIKMRRSSTKLDNISQKSMRLLIGQSFDMQHCYI